VTGAGPVRVGCVALGLLAASYGGWLLLRLGGANTRSTVVWLAGGVVLHDAVFAPLVVVLGLLALRVLPRRHLAPVVVTLVVVVPVTLAGIPELGRFGARPDNPTLLDRPYWPGWFVLVTLTVAAVVSGTVVRRLARDRSDSSGGGGDGPGRGRR